MVTGIDEPDLVKTDGKYIYFTCIKQCVLNKTLSNGDIIRWNTAGTKLVIIRAYPPNDVEIVFTRDYPGRIIRGILVENNTLILLFDNSAVIPCVMTENRVQLQLLLEPRRTETIITIL